MFLAVLMFFMHVFYKCFYKDVKNMFLMFFYLQTNVFNIYGLKCRETHISLLNYAGLNHFVTS